VTGARLRLLFAEDADDDFALVVRALRQTIVDLDVTRVDSAAAFTAALRDGDWDAVISDHSMPQFSSAAALALLRKDGRDLPFIVVSGTIDEETAVTILRAGAHDFVTKQNLARLGPALLRELKEAHNREERRIAQGDLRKQRDFLRLVIDASPNLVYVKDQSGRFVLVNRATAELYDTTVDALMDGARATEPPNVASALTDDGWDTLFQSPGRHVEAITDRRTGEVRWFDAVSVPLAESQVAPQRLVIATDITERKRTAEALRTTEAQLMHSQKMDAIGQLAGGIAHDFNNLLTVIIGFGQMALDRVAADQPDLAADLAEIVTSGQRASLLTQQLLAFSRKQVVEPLDLHLNTVVADLDKMLRRVIGEDVHLSTMLAPSLSYVHADRGQIEQVIVNLAVNARDAMPHGGALTIETAESLAPHGVVPPPGAPIPPSFVRLSVRDTGTGIPPEIQARIFEPFFTTKPLGEGTGLGLSTVYGIVLQCGGHVAVESAEGHGTTFGIYLPAVADAAAASPTGAPESVIARGHETVLLVEDEAAVRQLVQKTLVHYGYHVLSAANAAEAIVHAREFAGPIELLITDVVMPDVRGPALAKQLREMRPTLAVLYISGFIDSSVADAGPIDADTHFLQKPFAPSRLATKIRECLEP
jgi:two-component system, cell cycle sensor histidine kinase and response regulator CckA